MFFLLGSFAIAWWAFWYKDLRCVFPGLWYAAGMVVLYYLFILLVCVVGLGRVFLYGEQFITVPAYFSS